MYKNAAERETGLFEQVVMPLFKQRNPQARQQAMGTLEELSRLGRPSCAEPCCRRRCETPSDDRAEPPAWGSGS